MTPEENRAWRRDYMRKWNAENRGKVLSYRKITNAKPETKTRRKAWRDANPEKVVANLAKTELFDPQASRIARWKARNPDQVSRHSRISHQNRRARIGAGKITVGVIDTLMAEQGGKCPYCLSGLDGGYHLDHYQPLSRGGAHDDANIQLLCAPCNRRKGTKDPIVFGKIIFSLMMAA